MYLKFLQKPRCVGLFKQAKRSDPQWRKQGWIPLERQFHSEKLSFFHKKEAEHSFELSLSICVLYRRIFNLEIQNFSLEKKGKGRGGGEGAENMRMMNARRPFCWWMTFTIVGFHMTSLKFKLQNYIDPTEILLSRCITAAEN